MMVHVKVFESSIKLIKLFRIIYKVFNEVQVWSSSTSLQNIFDENNNNNNIVYKVYKIHIITLKS